MICGPEQSETYTMNRGKRFGFHQGLPTEFEVELLKKKAKRTQCVCGERAVSRVIGGGMQVRCTRCGLASCSFQDVPASVVAWDLLQQVLAEGRYIERLYDEQTTETPERNRRRFA